MARAVALHKKDIVLNKKKLKAILDSKGISYTMLHEKVVDSFGIDITYKGFMSLLSNRSSWKLLYSHAITEVLNITTNDVFEVVDVDIDKKIKAKKIWRERYEK